MTDRELLKEARDELISFHKHSDCKEGLLERIDAALADHSPDAGNMDALELVRKIRDMRLQETALSYKLHWQCTMDEAAALIESYGRRVPKEFVNDIFHAGFNTARCLPHDGTIAIAAKYGVKIEEAAHDQQ